MSTYLIWAAEETYQGLHGIYDIDVIESDSENWVQELAEEMSYNILSSYSEFEDVIEEEIAEVMKRDNLTEDEEEEVREDITREHLCYNWWKLSNEHTCEEYRKMLEHDDWEIIREKYAIR